MVCTVGSGRMAVMARLLQAESPPQNVPGNGCVGMKKLVSQYIHREIYLADEPNLLDEEDMDVFGLKPMDDPLHLVCCNACKKPIKDSRYAAHAEICRHLRDTMEAVSEFSYGADQIKPPRKERRNLLSDNDYQAATGRKPEQWEPIEPNDILTSELDNGGQGGFSYFSKNGIGNGCVDMLSMMNGKQDISVKEHQDSVMHPSTRGSKMVEEQLFTFSGYTETASTAATVISMQEGVKGAPPAPLATKMYCSQRNNRLRSEINQMYHATASQEFQNMALFEASREVVGQQHVTSNSVSSPRSNPDNYAGRRPQ